MQTPNTVVLLLLSLASVIFTLVLVCIFCITMEEGGGGIDARTKATCLMRKRGTFQKYTSSPLTWTTVKEWGEYRFRDHKLEHCPPPPPPLWLCFEEGVVHRFVGGHSVFQSDIVALTDYWCVMPRFLATFQIYLHFFIKVWNIMTPGWYHYIRIKPKKVAHCKGWIKLEIAIQPVYWRCNMVQN